MSLKNVDFIYQHGALNSMRRFMMRGRIFSTAFCILVLVSAIVYAGELQNGDFEMGLDLGDDSPWSSYVNDAAQADVNVVDTGGIIGSNCVLANITATSGTNWHVGVTQDNVTVMAGQTYTASVFLKADKNRQASLEVKRSPSEGGWEGITSGDFDITTEWAEYHVTFVPEKDYPDTAFFGIWIAQETGQVWVDGTRLSEGEYSAAAAVEPVAKITTTWGRLRAAH